MKQFIRRISVGALALAFICSGFGGAVTHAAESIAISPTSKRYTLDPGTTKSDTVTVINDGTEAYSFTVYARPYSVENGNYKPNFSRITGNGDAYKWITFDNTVYNLAPGQSAEIPYTVAVPGNADGGGHYGVILAETQPVDGAKQNVVRQKRVGVIVYATVSGNNRNSGDLISNTGSFLQTNAPLQASSVVRNTGNVDFIDTTSISVKDIFGNQKYQQTRQLPVLPSTTRNISYAWTNGPSFGLYNVSVSHAFLDKNFTKSFYVLLIPAWVLIVLVILIVGLVLYLSLKRRGLTSVKKTATKKSHASKAKKSKK